MKEEHSIIEYMPKDISDILKEICLKKFEEIRMRKGLPLVAVIEGECFMLGKNGIVSDANSAYIVTDDDIDYSVLSITNGSVYTYENEIKNGFVTVCGGNRVGIGGRGVKNDDGQMTVRDICSLNFRFARQIKSCAEEAVRFIRCGKRICSTIIVSPPGCGKTTLLREIARKISNAGFKVCIADERNEICAMQNGKTGYDVGINTDVYTNFSKKDAISMAIRCLSPQIIIADELGYKEDFEAVCEAAVSGVSCVCSIHAKSFEDLEKKENAKKIMQCFEKYIILGENKRIKSFGAVGDKVC